MVHTRIDAAGCQLGFSYDAYGRLTALTNENGEQYRFQYDAGDRLTENRPNARERVSCRISYWTAATATTIWTGW
ncbi:hypothetical protein DKK71_00640 [Snodgrassella alvi]|nr:RHS repeat domain-containing protein [Snodgrassella alvi]PXY98857.1 hypothetical protein DKK71_00640 [Snodgrassella alvi]